MAEAGTTAQPLFGVPVPTEATGKVAPGSGGTLGQLPLLAPASKPGSGQGQEKPTSWWGRPAMMSLWGGQGSCPPPPQRVVSGKARPVGFG